MPVNPSLSFSAQIDAWVRKTQQRMEAVVKNAAEAVAEDVINRTPVDTGFLRASLVATLDGPLPMRDAPPKDAAEGSFPPPTAYALVIEGLEMGGTLWLSFTANYAGYVEYGTKRQAPAGMVRLAAQNWPRHVAKAVREAKAAVVSRQRG